MEEENNKLEKFVEKGADITGALSGAGIGLILGGPLGALAGAVAAPILTTLFQKVGFEMTDKFLAPREEIKVGATFSLTSELIATRLNNGDLPREDSFFESKDHDRSDAESILEGTLLKCRNEHEEKKLKYYSYFLSNLTFDSTVSFSKANAMLKIVEQLSYRQLCIIAFFHRANRLEFNNWARAFNTSVAIQEYLDFYFELLDLYNKQILKQYDGIGMGVRNGELSEFGKCLLGLMQLFEIPNEEVQLIEDTIGVIAKMSE